MKFIAVFAVVLAIHGCMAKPTQTDTRKSLEGLEQSASKLAHDLADKMGLNDVSAEKVSKRLNESTEKFLTTLESLINKVQAESKSHEGDVRDAFRKMEDSLTATADSLTKQLTPDLKKKADDIQHDMEAALKSTIDQINKVANDPKVLETPNDVKKFSEDFLNAFITLTKKLDGQVTDIYADHAKTHTV